MVIIDGKPINSSPAATALRDGKEQPQDEVEFKPPGQFTATEAQWQVRLPQSRESLAVIELGQIMLLVCPTS